MRRRDDGRKEVHRQVEWEERMYIYIGARAPLDTNSH